MDLEIETTLQALKQASTAKQRVLLIGKLSTMGVANRTIEKATHLRDYQIRHYLRVFQKLSPEVMALFTSDKLSFSLARAIASLPLKQQEKAARNAIAKRTSVTRFRSGLKGNTDQQLNAELERLGDRYSALSGLNIAIKADRENPKAGVWMIRYTNLDMFDAIAEIILQGKHKEDY